MTGLTLAVHVERYVDTKHNQKTRTWYAKDLRPMVDFLGPDRSLDSVTRADGKRYWRSVQARKTCWNDHPTKPTERRPLSSSTLHNHLRAARAFWNEMVRQRLEMVNRVDHLKAPRDTRPVEMKAISAEDLRAIWRAALDAGKRDFAMITLMATTGIRAGELVSMSLTHLDLKQGMAWVNGKRGWRKVFLGKASVQAIQSYMRERGPGRYDALWLNAQGKPLTTDGIRQIVDRLAAEASVTGRYNLHAFRHAVAQAWLDNSINAEIVSKALGHADITMTLMIYGNQDDRRVSQAVREAEMAPFYDPGGTDDLALSDIAHALVSGRG